MIEVTIQDRTPEKFAKMQRAIWRFVVKGAAYIEGQIRALMEEPKSGRMYGKHRASAPGEAPAVESNNLIGSITVIKLESALEAIIGTPVEYGLYLETGTRAPARRGGRRGVGGMIGPVMNVMGPHRGGMAARPVWKPTADAALPTLENMLRNEIRGV